MLCQADSHNSKTAAELFKYADFSRPFVFVAPAGATPPWQSKEAWKGAFLSPRFLKSD